MFLRSCNKLSFEISPNTPFLAGTPAPTPALRLWPRTTYLVSVATPLPSPAIPEKNQKISHQFFFVFLVKQE
jgi:hypothetical protein